MHMADALISPAVGGTMLAATAGVAAYSVRKVQKDLDERKIPLMGVVGAFVFASQMVNFTIPGTGSSGHLGGGMLLAILLGPSAGFLTMASVLIIQALFFADGGLLALGCNIFNLGFYTCFLAYPLIYKKIVRKGHNTKRIFIASIASAIIGLQIGSLSVVMQTFLSGKTELPFWGFLALMQPIHLAIGIVEGIVTAAVVVFLWKSHPEILEKDEMDRPQGRLSFKKVLIILTAAALLTGGVISWFASSNPDGLEWSMVNVSGQEELESSNPVHEALAVLQEKIAFLPDYGFKESSSGDESGIVNAGTSLSGLAGGAMTLMLACVIGMVISKVKRYNKNRLGNVEEKSI